MGSRRENALVTWLKTEQGIAQFDAALALRPELRDLYAAFYGKLWDDELLPSSLLEICRLRVAQLHECEAELAVRHEGASVSEEQIRALANWQESDLFSEPEKAALTLSEKVPWQHHDLTDEDYSDLRTHFGEAKAVALTVGIALFDANCRLRLAFDTDPTPIRATRPASSQGPIY